MAKANAQLSKTRLFDPNKVQEEFGLKIIGNCMSPVLKEGEFVVVDRRKKIKSGDLVVIYYKPEFVARGEVQARIKRIVHAFPAKVKFPFVYNAEQFANTGLGPIVIVEQINPKKTYPVDLRTVMGIYHAERCPADVTPVVTPVPKKALLKRPAAKEAKELRRAAA
jgi:hypothetical protein